MHGPATVYTLVDFVRRVVESLLRGDCRGQVLCSRCLVKLTRNHLDRSYTKPDVERAMEDIFTAPGPLAGVTTTRCALCARKKVPCLATVPPSA